MQHLSTDLKLRAVPHDLQNRNCVETSELFQVPRTTSMRWVQKFQDDDTIERKERDYVAHEVHNKHVKEAKELLRKDPTITMKQLCEKLRDRFDDFDVTPQWFGILRDKNLTRKRTRINHQPEKRYNKDFSDS